VAVFIERIYKLRFFSSIAEEDLIVSPGNLSQSKLKEVFSSILNIHATMQWSEVDNATSEECKLDSTWRLPFLAKPEQFREYLHRAFNNMFFIGLPKDIYIKLVPSVQCKLSLLRKMDDTY